tara:strand:- start:54871 stop:55989 length:1119 start_codon:yes stop_codon:yes gene_type:complete
MPQYFPLGLAKGQAFCNRIAERKRLKHNINKGQHSLVIATRRYGKSSLVLYVLNDMEVPYASADLFIAVSDSDIEAEILLAVKALLNQLTSKLTQSVDYIKNFIKQLKLKLVIGSDGINLELIPENGANAAQNIKSVLLLVESILKKQKQRAVLFIDEFQEISKVASAKSIEGAIRHIAQQSEYLSLVFSGSNRHLLSNMFEDKSRPLYRLCDRIPITRIHEEDYVNFIQNIATKTWKKSLTPAVLSSLFQLTERHPYYINVLCGRIWAHFTKSPPTKAKQIELLWREYVQEQKSEIIRELSFISELQKKILVYIASGNNQKLTSKLSIQTLDTTSGAIVKALSILQEKDYITRTENNEYYLIDPLLKSAIS